MTPFTLVLLLCGTGWCLGFSCYDCTESAEQTIFSVLDPPTCQLMEGIQSISNKTLGSILQFPKSLAVPSRSCRGSLVTKHVYCSWTGLPSELLLTHNTVPNQPILMDEAQCSSIWAGLPTQIGQFKVNLAGSARTITPSNGGRTSDGFCAQKSSYVQMEFLMVEKYASTTEFILNKQGQIAEVMVDGEVAVWQSGALSGVTSLGTRTLWGTTLQASCLWESVYTGPVLEVRSKMGTTQVVLPTLSSAFSLGASATVCGLEVVTTNDPFVFYVPDARVNAPVLTKGASARWSSYFKSGLQYIQTLSKEELTTHIRTIQKSQCDLEMTLFREVMFSSKWDSEQAAYRLMDQHGWSVKTIGAAVVLLKCSVRECLIREETKCYNKIPVNATLTSNLLFMDPLTRTLSYSAQMMDCTSPMLPITKIRDQWYRMAPKPTLIPSPPPLPSRLWTHKDVSLETLAGLYPDEVVEEMELGMDHVEKNQKALNALLHSVDQTLGDPSSGYTVDTTGLTYGMSKHSFWSATAALVLWNVVLSVGVLVLWCTRSGRSGPSVVNVLSDIGSEEVSSTTQLLPVANPIVGLRMQDVHVSATV